MLLEIGIALAVVALLTAVWWLDGAVPGWLADKLTSRRESDTVPDLVEDALMTIDPCDLGVVESEERYRLAAVEIAAGLGASSSTSAGELEQRVVSALAAAGCGEPISPRRLSRLVTQVQRLGRT